MRIDSSGNVGIGTSSPSFKLSVAGGGISTQTSANDGALVFLPLGGSNENRIYSRSSATGTGNKDLAFRIGDTERLRIDSSGRLLVGTTTARAVGGESNPRLQIEGSGPTSNSWVNITRFADSTGAAAIQFGKSRSDTPGTYTVVQDDDSLGTIVFAGADGTDLANYGAKIAAEVDGTPGSNDMPGRLVFSTTADGASSPTERLRIDSSGNVGIGTSSPTGYIHIEGASTGTETYGRFTTGPANGDQSLVIKSGSSRDHMAIQVSTIAGVNDDLALQPDGGNVGIGTTSPSSFGPTLQIAGTDPALILEDTATAVDFFGTNITSGLVTNWYDDAAAWRIGTANGINWR